ncbi:MFS transporter [Pseudonocardia sp. MH-G8]|uniref:MFS transporter n=1 Tax=Pseudonocardia sp. MH-G8 TaxID=1854588 RepID=UPI000BA03894|nr:MFS transporter [Pseudonocardia sp. MH-G8]OZM75758.1 MFS transporter [Pseudonocardia sp. MH-G8]
MSTTTPEFSRGRATKTAAGTIVGTAIEWYDFFLYGTASALVFGEVFFPEFSSSAGTIAAFGTFAAGYVARPLGAIVFGHFGDRIGRKAMLVTTLLIMGAASTLIGVIPSYDSIGVWAPILLVVLRLVQGLAVGGEWGGAVLIAVEDAPSHRRALFGTFPQLGVPLGLLLSTAVMSLVAGMSEEDFLNWGWRLPFLFSAFLVVVALLIRLQLPETDAFKQLKETRTEVKVPLFEALRRHPKNLLLALGTRFATDITFNVANVFMLTYGTTELGYSRQSMLNAIIIASAVELITIPVFGVIADRIGKRRMFMLGSAFVAVYGFMFFWLVESGEGGPLIIAYIFALAFSQASVYAVQSALFAELFPPNVRYTAASLPYQFAGVITSGPAPLIATSLFLYFEDTWPIAVYIALTAVISLVSAYFMRAGRPDTEKVVGRLSKSDTR